MSDQIYQQLKEQVIQCGQEQVLRTEYADSNLELLADTEKSYRAIGGIKGYHEAVLSLINQKDEQEEYHSPEAFSIADSPKEVMMHGIKGQKELVEFYPMGGACERLAYTKGGEAQPAALFSFLGHTLLEHLIRDLEGREALYRNTFGERVETPIVLMVSDAKGNMDKIQSYLEKRDYFGRNKEQVYLIKQPSIPVVNREGLWQLDSLGKLIVKPGGHGMLWNVVKEEGLYEHFMKQGKRKIFVRQINNPIAGLDKGLITFIGWGFYHDQHFGFYACDRKPNLKEGVHVMKKTHKGYCLSNQEYCVLSSKVDHYVYSNTNLLFADIDAISNAIEKQPFPGLLLNFKDNTARLESSMQNISELFCASSKEDYHPDRLASKEYIPRSFMTTNARHKTMSVTKKPYKKTENIEETPMGALRDYLLSTEELLTKYCHSTTPQWDKDAYFSNVTMPFFFKYHPQLGPAFSKIGLKLSKIVFEQRSALDLECKEAYLSEMHIKGSVSVTEQKVGSSKAIFNEVSFSNTGYLFSSLEEHLVKTQCAEGGFFLYLEENSEFIADGVSFIGPYSIIVPKNTTMHIVPDGNQHRIIYGNK